MDKKEPKKTKKRLKLRIKVLAKLLLFIAVLGALFYYVQNLNIKNIVISGNEVIKDYEIIEQANIKNYPKLFKLNKKDLINKIKNIPLIETVEVKRNLAGKITINVTEKEILFYYKYKQKYITEDFEEIDDGENIIGYPTLINFTPDSSLKELTKGLKKIDVNIIKMINEIEYTPYKKSDGTTIEESSLYINSRFTLHMNDENTVIIDTINFKRLQSYPTAYVSLNMDQVKGTLHLDTINEKKATKEETILFKSYESQNG